LEAKIKELDRENYLLAQKLAESEEKGKENLKLVTELSFANKVIEEQQRK
jgi:hypothetical protein